MNKPTNCPKCDSKRVKRIVYGLIRLSVWEYFLPRDWVAGGCSVKDDSANCIVLSASIVGESIRKRI